jgi:ribosomal-protein-serine acetyltransferase
MTISVDSQIKLELTNDSQVDALFVAIRDNREHLSKFLPWVEYMQFRENLYNYIKTSENLIDQQKETSFAIFFEGSLVGRVGLHHLDMHNKIGSIGYWIIREAEGKGIITKSCKVLVNYGFKELGLNRIEIKAALFNIKSQAIPERLNFKKEGILRQAELVNDEYLDLVLYSKLLEDL